MSLGQAILVAVGVLVLLGTDLASATAPVMYIVGGGTAAPAEYPFMVRLLMVPQGSNQGAVCGGTLVRPDWVLTAAHCLDAGPYDTIDAFVGTNDDFIPYLPDLTGYGGVFVHGDETSGIYLHPLWAQNSGPTLNGDLALLHLRSDAIAAAVAHGTDFLPRTVALHGTTSPLLSGGSTALDLGEAVTTAGWGATSVGGSTQAATLQSLSTTLRSCSSWSGIATTIVCAGTTQTGAEHATCVGDSGGPLLRDVDPTAAVSWLQVGITSFGPEDCSSAENLPGAFSNVAQLVGFVDATLAAHAGIATLAVHPVRTSPYADVGFRLTTVAGAPITDCRVAEGLDLECTGTTVHAAGPDRIQLAPATVVLTAYGLAQDGTEVAQSTPKTISAAGGRVVSASPALRPLLGNGTTGSGFAVVQLAPQAPFASREVVDLSAGAVECVLAEAFGCTAGPVLPLAPGYVAVPAPAPAALTAVGQVEGPPGTWSNVTHVATSTLALRGGQTLSYTPPLVPLGAVVKLAATRAPYAVSLNETLVDATGNGTACHVDILAATVGCSPVSGGLGPVQPLAFPYIGIATSATLHVTGQAFADEGGTDLLATTRSPITVRPVIGHVATANLNPTLSSTVAVLHVVPSPVPSNATYEVHPTAVPADSSTCHLVFGAAPNATSCTGHLDSLAAGYLRLSGIPAGTPLDHHLEAGDGRVGGSAARPLQPGRVATVTLRIR